MPEPFSSVTVLGPGLLGGSVALAVRQSMKARVALWARRPEAVAELLHRGFQPGEVTADLARAVAGAELVVLACPVGAMPGLITEVGRCGGLAERTVVTDVGSVKAAVVEALTPAVAALGGTFVGSHPMAGSENAGIAHARADLLSGATCIVTPGASTPGEELARVRRFWELLGMRVRELDASAHDLAIARVSHLPHLAAAVLVTAALQPRPEDGDLCGNGLRDSTRVAKGGEAMWSEILLENRDALLDPVRNLRDLLSEMLVFLENRDQEKLAGFLRQAKELRQRLDPTP